MSKETKFGLINGENLNALYVIRNGERYGLFYHSYEKKSHLMSYEPYKRIPTISVCGIHPRNPTPTGSEDRICDKCLEWLKNGQ
jgi:hypothetical protein